MTSTRKKNKRPISVISIRGTQPDRLAHAKETAIYLETVVSQAVTEAYNSLQITFSLDQIPLDQLKKVVVPLIISALCYGTTELVSTRLSRIMTGNDDNDFVFKFLASGALLAYSAKQRITDKHITATAKFYIAAALELVASAYLYSSSFRGSRKLLEGLLSNSHSLLLSLSTSAFLIPGVLTYYSQKFQQNALSKQYSQGAQRSDTALISSGMTQVGNSYFLTNRLLLDELYSVPRGFQIGLIFNNILQEPDLTRQFKNVPACVIDMAPLIMRKQIAQIKKAKADYTFNTAPRYVLKLNNDHFELSETEQHRLRAGDLVWCGKEFNPLCAPVSGKVIALSRDEQGHFAFPSHEHLKFQVNLESYTGEKDWIKFETSESALLDSDAIDARAIQDKKQLAILDGAKINFFGRQENFFVRIANKKEQLRDSAYEKKSVINQIINQYKERNIVIAIAASSALGIYMGGDVTTVAGNSVRLLFSLFQMMIPFSESFLREWVNSNLMKKINRPLGDMPLETIDALRISDLWFALSNHYPDKFPKGVAIISDKTGTLTTTEMKSLGFWTPDMKPNEHTLHRYLVPTDTEQQAACFEIFACAFTNSKKELEPEEHSILDQFKSLFKDDQCLQLETIRNNYYRKTIRANERETQLETRHLGLYTALGGRLTLVSEDDNKFLVFCGIPKADKFHGTDLLKKYSQMQTRTGVLSRDWCVAVTSISDELFTEIADAFDKDDKQKINEFMTPELLKKFFYYCTFLLDNPVKEGVNDFIPRCHNIGVPVFVATGDTAQAAQNIAKVLCADRADTIITIRASKTPHELKMDFPPNTTIIFAGLNNTILKQFDNLMAIGSDRRPNIIFAEMSTDEKGLLAQHLKKKGYFVVANGDGSNDVAMMKEANFVIGHLTPEGTYAPGIAQYVNLNDEQLRRLNHSKKSFYDLFDIDELEDSRFILPFVRLANSQDMVSQSLVFKTIKMSFVMAKELGVPNVEDMWQQHWFSIAVDLIWLWISYNKINQHSDLPVDEKHLGRSLLPVINMLATIALAAVGSYASYELLGESTNFVFISLILGFLPTLLSSFFSGYKQVQEEMKPLDPPWDFDQPSEPQNALVLAQKRQGFFRLSCLKKPTELDVEEHKFTSSPAPA